MDRSTIYRFLLILGGTLLFLKFVMPKLTGHSDTPQAVRVEAYVNAPDFAPDKADGAKTAPPEGDICSIKGNRFVADLSSRGAGLKNLFLEDPQYAAGSVGLNLSTTPDQERWRNLRTLFREPSATAPSDHDQVKFDRFLWKTESLGATGCKFTYADADVSLEKTIVAGERPFELDVTTTVKNLAAAPKTHRLSIEAFAYRTNQEVKGKLGRVSPFQTDLSCARGKEVTRKSKDDFKEGWFSQPLDDRYAAISNTFFAQAIVPVSAPPGTEAPECELLAEQWFSPGQHSDDDTAGAVYHATLEYPAKELKTNESATYKETAFFGPKEREILAAAGGGNAKLGDLINLGFFSPVAKILVGFLAFFHDHVTFGNWGLAIAAMTICLRLGLFPLSLPQIKTMVAMRRIKPEIDAANKKYAHDMQAKQMATMEIYRKHGVNPLGGCLPQLVQMPVWWAMYTTLQTAVEMYHVHFLWFKDLSSPDQYYLLPLLLGALMILQQRIVPQQGMDPMQQKMMMYMMPAIFTVMMLFLPAALGVYMLTNSAMGILQQLAVQKFAPNTGASGGTGGGKGEIVVKAIPDKALPEKA